MSKGTYCLILLLDKNIKIKVGKKSYYLLKGYYCYIGSALNNLEKRIQRHLSKNKKLRWNIDYFLRHVKIIKIKTIIANKKLECFLSNKIKDLSNMRIKDFGSNDCKCKSHLYFFNKNPIYDKNFLKLFKVI